MLILYPASELALTDDDKQVYIYWGEGGRFHKVVLVDVEEWEELHPCKEDKAPWEWEE